VPNVVGLAQTDAAAAFEAAGLGSSFSQVFDPVAPANLVMSQNPAAGTNVVTGTVVTYVVSLGPAPVAPVAQATVTAQGTGARSVTLSTTTPGEVLVAFAGSDGPTTGTNTQNLTISGAGLTWTRVQRAATSRGVSEIWTATAPTVLTNATVTSTQSVTVVLGAPVNQMLTVVAFTGVSGIGNSASFSGVSTNATGSLLMSATGSAVYGIGNDFDRAVSRTVGAGQTRISQFLAPTGDTFWAQSLNNVASIKGSTQTLNATAAGAADQWNFAMVELLR
jgi:PASTA domain-containing protein